MSRFERMTRLGVDSCLQVALHSAAELRGVNRNGLADGVGTVRLLEGIGHKDLILSTPVIANNRNPIWDEATALEDDEFTWW